VDSHDGKEEVFFRPENDDAGMDSNDDKEEVVLERRTTMQVWILTMRPLLT
jgi:hypothetical protein